MKKRNALIIPIIFLPFCLFSQDKTFMSDYFTNNQLNATLVIVSLDGSEKHVYNEQRANEAFLPASTFKIPNTLIALQEKAIKDENEVIKWDSIVRGPEGWNHDQNLQSAFKVSCVWFYQELAQRVGNEVYLKYLKQLNYGNHLTGWDTTSFWLNGDLRISAYQQIDFIRHIYKQEFPFDQTNYNILKKIMLADSTTSYKMYAKTGWTSRVEQEIGWYVGYVESKGKVWLFACNFEVKDESQLRFRKEAVYAGFRELGIINQTN